MTTVPPPTAPPLPPVAQASPAPVTMILAPPPAIAALAAGTPLEGVVVQSTPTDAARTDVLIHTADGDITLKLPAPLPQGAVVDLEIVRANADQATVRLIAVDDQPATQVLNQALAQARQATPAPLPADPIAAPPTSPALLPPGNAWTPSGPVALTELGTFSARVLEMPGLSSPAGSPAANAMPGAASPQAAAAALQPFALIPGGELAVRITSIVLPDQDAAAPTLLPTVAAAPAGAPTTGSIPAPTVAPGMVISEPAAIARIPDAAPTPAPLDSSPATNPGTPAVPDAAAPQATASTAPAPSPSAPLLLIAGREGLPPAVPTPPVTVAAEAPQAVLTGTVVNVVSGATPNPTPVIATENGQIQLNLRANLPAGTRLLLEIGMQLPPQPGALAPLPPATSLPLAGATPAWPSLTEALEVLARVDPPAAAQLAEVIPDGGPRTALALVAFVQAMRSGDTRQWPGETNLRALERLGPRGAHLAGQIGDEIGALSSRAREASTEWRALPIPWNADGRVDRITLITRREGEADTESGKKRGRGGTRFLIMLDLSRLGAMQLDGMFRRETKGFDLIIRTKAALPDVMRLDLTGLFAASTAAMGLKGGLAFQVVKSFPDPLARPELGKSGVWA